MAESIQEKTLPRVEPLKCLLACVAAAFVPGAGHIVLRRYGRGALFAVCIYSLVVLGILMQGHLYQFSDPERLAKLYFVSDLGIGLLYPILYVLEIGHKLQPVVTTFEYGTNFLATAGLLNYLIILDAYDIAVGRKP